MRKHLNLLLALGVVLLAGCGGATTPPATAVPTTAVVPTSASSPAPTVATVPPSTVPPVATPATAAIPVDVDPALYIDNRSDAVAILQSLYNAVNRKEYARAYFYWDAQGGAMGAPPFAQFQQGYNDTAAVQLAVGAVGLGAGAGNLWYTVPAILVASQTGGTTQTFVGCYLIHQSQPGFFGAPPFQPMTIREASVQQVASGADAAGLLAQACQAAGFSPEEPMPPLPTPNPGDISAARYIDDRSGPVEVLQSLYNAVNRNEYVRAYSYWEPGAVASQLPPYPQFEQGYSNTISVQLLTGQVSSDAGAGQLYYKVPVALITTLTGGGTQTFVGCYTLHLARPEIQTEPPFQPLGIASANIVQVPDDADLTALLGQACP